MLLLSSGLKPRDSMGNRKGSRMEEGHHETVLDYLKAFKGLGVKQFLETYTYPFLVENYLAPSSKIKLGRVETISEFDLDDIFPPSGKGEGELVLQARVIPLEKRDVDSSERMIFVGRSANNDIVLANKMVSKLHAYFCQVPGSGVMQLVDMTSTNGTFVNGTRLAPSVKSNLEDEDVISFGPETKLEFFSPASFCQLLQRLA
jgi:S-DNA-T family DNA segregation ATPase FtsK/SpoIIIE